MNPEQFPVPQPSQPPSEGVPPVAPQAFSQPPVAPSSFETQAPTSTTSDMLGTGYLDKIAPTEKKTINRFAIFGLIGGVLVLVIVILAILMNSSGPSLATQAKSINARIATLQTVTDAQQKHLKENSISEANTTLASVLTSMNTDLAGIMKTKKITASDSKTKVASEEKAYSSTLAKKLDDAYQRGTLDRIYAPQMVYELSIMRSKLVALKKSSTSDSIDTFCNTSIANVDAVLKAFTAFSSTK